MGIMIKTHFLQLFYKFFPNRIVRSPKSGFTLFELLIVIIIISILVGIAVPSFNRMVRLARLESQSAHITQLASSGGYQEAHTIMSQLLLDAAGKKSGYLKTKDLENPAVCDAMLAVDRGWNRARNHNMYSFTEQAAIYKNSKARNGWNKYQDFMLRVGWAHLEKGILPPNFSENAPAGHMPYWDDTFKERGDKGFHFFREFERCKKN